MSNEPMTDKPEKKPWGGAVWTLLFVGCLIPVVVGACLLTVWIRGSVNGEKINARKMASVKIGMTPAEVEELLGAPVIKTTMGVGIPHEYVYSYQGFGATDRIDVTFDSDFKVIRVERSSLPPTWLRHIVG
jgi:outer membrane protein assembly factor BamE (lipoprotein component of BamABCDE complex)